MVVNLSAGIPLLLPETRLGKNFNFKIGFQKVLLLILYIRFKVDSAMSPIMVNVLGNWKNS